MADEFNASANWWESPRNRFQPSSQSSSSSSGVNSLGTFAWPCEMVDAKARPSVEYLPVPDSDGDLNMMGLALSSQTMDWNHDLLHGSKAECGFRFIVHENLNCNAAYQPEPSEIASTNPLPWRDSSSSINLGFSLDQRQLSPHRSSNDGTFQMEGSSIYDPSSSSVLHGILMPADASPQPPHRQSSPLDNTPMAYPYEANYGGLTPPEIFPCWSKVPQYLKNSPPKQPHLTQINFSNNSPFWHAPADSLFDVQSTISYPSSESHFPESNLQHHQPKARMPEVGGTSGVGKKGGNDASVKKPRNEMASSLPPFKVRKEKMGDRITALQQLVSPFGKTDTASVLSEAIQYIKFLHEQVSVLSTPYMKAGAPVHHQQCCDNSKESEGQDLRSRGLCLVPISSTYPVTHESADFWTPTFGGTFR